MNCSRCQGFWRGFNDSKCPFCGAEGIPLDEYKKIKDFQRHNIPYFVG